MPGANWESNWVDSIGFPLKFHAEFYAVIFPTWRCRFCKGGCNNSYILKTEVFLIQVEWFKKITA